MPEVDQIAHQEVAIPATGERACSRPQQDEHQVPEWGNYGITRGLGGISGRPPGGHQPLRRACKEGHYNDQRYPTGTVDPGREVVTQVLTGPQQKLGPFWDHHIFQKVYIYESVMIWKRSYGYQIIIFVKYVVYDWG